MDRPMTDYCFLAAFQDADTEETHLSLDATGAPSVTHFLDRLPGDWIIQRDPAGQATAVKRSIVAGYVRSGRFFSPAELARIPFDG